MTFNGFTQETLDFYPRLRAGGNTTQAYNSMKPVYHKYVKPQMIELLEHISHSLESNIPVLQYDSSQDLGLPTQEAAQ